MRESISKGETAVVQPAAKGLKETTPGRPGAILLGNEELRTAGEVPYWCVGRGLGTRSHDPRRAGERGSRTTLTSMRLSSYGLGRSQLTLADACKRVV